MKRYSFELSFTVEFANLVRDHSYLLRVLPRNDDFQHVEELEYAVQGTRPVPCIDAFGNAVLTGIVIEEHRLFTASVSGRVRQRPYRVLGAQTAPYLHATELTLATPAMRAWAREACGAAGALPRPADDRGEALAAARELAHRIHETVEYRPGATHTRTRAVEVFASRRGVCQDFAHLAVAMCRGLGLAARYAFGFVPGEGASHAWFEVFSDGAWHGIDPTSDHEISTGYIKVAHGRDTFDCPMNRGSLSGLGNQKQTLSITVTEL